MKAIRFNLTIPRYALGLALGKAYPSLLWSGLSCTSLAEVPEPRLPGEDWVLIKTRYGGVCGTDIGTIHLHTSPYYSPLNSARFTFGHENLGQIMEVGSKVKGWQVGERVVVEPLLWCRPRGFTDLCPYCAAGQINRCERLTDGAICPSVMTGFCQDTGGSWAQVFAAHTSQLYRLPDEINDENGLLVEPFAVGLHAALQGYPKDNETVLIIGAGSIGLCTLAALRALGSHAEILVLARYPFQAEAAEKVGASRVISASRGRDYYDDLAELTGARLFKPIIGKRVVLGGLDRTFECVGSDTALDDALRLTRAGGQVVLAGVPGIAKGVDWTALFASELDVRAANAYHHSEEFGGERFKTFDRVIDWLRAGQVDLSWMVTHRYRLEDYRRALTELSNPGKNGAIKGVFAF